MGVRKKTRSHTAKSRSQKRAGQSRSATQASQAGPTPEERIWQVVALIPPGRVASYGQVAALAGMPAHARFVGRTLKHLPAGSRLPWFRVINASRRISFPRDSAGYQRQRSKLEAEGVEFVGERVASQHLWDAQG